MHSLRKVWSVRRRRRRRSVCTRHSCLLQQSGHVVNSACAWWRSNCCASCSRHQVHVVVCARTRKQANRQIQTKSGRSEPVWSLTTDDWSGCVHVAGTHVAGTLSDSEEEEAVGTHATVVSSDVEEHNAGYQSGVGVLGRRRRRPGADGAQRRLQSTALREQN